jgi:large subunit ribosomal protein L17
MRHRNRRGKLGKKTEHRLMMLRNMATSLFDKERIKTTMPKAKQLRPFAEKLITIARRQDLHSRRLTMQYIQDPKVAKKLMEVIALRFKDAAKGGYTRIVPYKQRWGDGAELAFVELKDFNTTPVEVKKGGKKGEKKPKAEAKPKEEAKPKAEKPRKAKGKKDSAQQEPK